jgi:hypothetical protein
MGGGEDRTVNFIVFDSYKQIVMPVSEDVFYLYWLISKDVCKSNANNTSNNHFIFFYIGT